MNFLYLAFKIKYALSFTPVVTSLLFFVIFYFIPSQEQSFPSLKRPAHFILRPNRDFIQLKKMDCLIQYILQ